MESHPRHRPDRRLSRHSGRREADEGGRPRVDHQHFVDRGYGRDDRLPRLHGHQVRGARADEIHRFGVGAQRNSGQLDSPGVDQDTDDRVGPNDIFQTALGRAAEPKEVSSLVVYLASDESAIRRVRSSSSTAAAPPGLGHKDFSTVETEQQPEWVT